MHETAKKPPYLMIGILFFGAFVAFLNNTLLNVALPTIMVDLNIEEYSTVQWLSTGYMLVSGVLVPASAFLITKFKNRHIFIVSMGLFLLGTIMAAFAPSFGILLAGRMVQAAGAATMSPLLMNIMLVSFPIEKRGAVMGIFGLVMISAPAIGPTLSGWIVEHYDWRLLFEMIIPFAVISLLLAVWKLGNVMETRDVTLDYFSIVLSTIGFGGLLYGFSMAGSVGWGELQVYGTIIVGAIALVWFIIRQLTIEQPLLDLRTYKYPAFALASVISMVISVAMFSGMILTPAYVQTVRGISPLDAGLMMLPGALVMGIMSPITGKLFDKFGPKVLAITGLSIMTISTYMLTILELDTSYAYIVGVYTIRMFGMSMVMMPIMTNGLNSIPQRLNPHGTAINNTAQQVAGAIGTAVLVTIMTNKVKEEAAALGAKAQEAMQNATTALTDAQIAEMTAEITKQATLASINHTFMVATVVSAVALVLAFFLKRVDVTKRAQ